jgi:hypothetical protein
MLSSIIFGEADVWNSHPHTSIVYCTTSRKSTVDGMDGLQETPTAYFTDIEYLY